MAIGLCVCGRSIVDGRSRSTRLPVRVAFLLLHPIGIVLFALSTSTVLAAAVRMYRVSTYVLP